MHVVDLVVVCAALLLLALCAIVLARQQFMLKAAGTMPVAIRTTSAVRWQYGVARYAGGELRWYRSLGLGTRPSRVLDRRDLQVFGRRAPMTNELQTLPSTAVVVECRDRGRTVYLALGEDAYPGFVSWVEASSPLP